MYMKILLKTFLGTLVLMGVFTASNLAVMAQSQPVQPVTTTRNSIQDNVCRGVLSAETGTLDRSATIDSCTQSSDGTQGFGALVSRIVNLFSIVVGSVSVIMIIVGGFRYIISGGDSAGVTSAKNTILYAIVGLVIVLFSQVIIRFVISNFKPQ